MKKGFTLPELLFALAILSFLFGLAIYKMKSSPERVYKNSMKNDAINAIYENYFIKDETGDYDSIEVLKDTVFSENGGKFSVSPFNSLTIETTTCGDGSKGFYLVVKNSKVKNYEVYFDKCASDLLQERNV